MKVQIKEIIINETKNDGTAFIDKNQQPYKMANLKIEGDEKQYSMFIGSKYGKKDEDIVSTWRSGQEVDVALVQNGQYWNFKIPNETDKLKEVVDSMKNWALKVNSRLDDLEGKKKEKVEIEGKETNEEPPKDINWE